MILTGEEIKRQVARHAILIDPFCVENINPNSYNFCLAPILRVYDAQVLDAKIPATTSDLRIPPEGLVLQPSRLYLASTIERMGSAEYVPTYAARSSVARLGMFINLSAPLGDIGYMGNWTIQLYCLHPVRVYAGMKIGQMMFWKTTGEILLYKGKYQGSSGPCASLIHRDFALHSNEDEGEVAALPLGAE
jgi:dCTP deaminase